MAASSSHFSFSIALAALYAAGGVSIGISPEHALLAAVLIVICGMLPNVDQPTSTTAKEFAGLLAAVSPLVALQVFPSLNEGGVPRLVLTVIVCFLITRFIIQKSLLNFTVPRGMFHSVPAAIISAQLSYLLFWDIPVSLRAFLALASFAGFFLHLVMDGYGNLNIVGKALGKNEAKTPAMKFWSPHLGANILTYGLMITLGWIVAHDFFPGLGLYAGVTY